MLYICRMKNEILIPEHFPKFKEEDIKAATKRREEYSLIRDIKAKEYNEEIARRLKRESDTNK